MQPEQKTALLYSVGLHVGIVLVLFLSTQQTYITPPKGIAIQAEIMDLDQFMQQAPKPTEQKPKPVVKPPEPKPEPVTKPPEPKPEPVQPKPAPRVEPKPEPKEVVKPTIDTSKRAEKTDRQKRLEELRKKRQEAEAQAQQQPEIKPAETPVEQPVQANPPVGVENGDAQQKRTLLTQYMAAIQSAVTRQWARPSGTPAGLKCQIKVNQIPGGGVIDVSIGRPCNASATVRNSIINAVKKADPLPFSGFEDVFDRRINFNFTYDGD
ncbi:TonB C-terminal domain-containing protein [Marinicella sediminis]|uniref:TonB C-terminal domain-containing protein n=1 Tax=Marinicella sediminis TaxID=1792834 RepID=A0ABV7JAH2_9GAMM|nr:cell envelope integrity protein TolA [Marinicella sediminis]